jgi:teichuronic acid biosynthesis glycosyltransferase TuaG
MISIITPNYNSEKYISEMILSVINQTYKNWELLITDDCSTDDSINIINKFIESDSHIGAGLSRNYSIEKSNGKYLAFLDSDDIWVTNKLEKQRQFMEKNSFQFSFTAYSTFKNGLVSCKHIKVPLKVSLNDILKTCDIYTSTVIVSNSILKKGMPDIRRRQDFLTWVYLLKNVKYAYAINEPLTGYRLSEESLSSNKLNVAKIQWICYRKHLNLSLVKSFYYFVHYAFNGFIKRQKQKNTIK